MINTVLCIDDDLITLALCEMVIKKSLFAEEVVSAKNGKEGLSYFSSFFTKSNTAAAGMPPELIFLDLNMPIMNGWDFLEEYLTKYAHRLPNTKVVIVSSTVNPEDFLKANRYDIVIDFINKPLTVEGMEELMEHDVLQPYFTA